MPFASPVPFTKFESVMHPQTTAAESLAVLVSDLWLDEFCEHVGSLCAALKALSRTTNDEGPSEFVADALEHCESLQKLLNTIPVWAGFVPPFVVESTGERDASRGPSKFRRCVQPHPPFDVLGDSFPEFASADEEPLVSIDKERLEERFEYDVTHMVDVLQKFRIRADGDLRQLELLSVGHDWTRLARLAGALKDAAAHVSAYRIVVDAAALQGAARVGCRNDVDLALDALRADLRDCARHVDELLAERSTKGV
jgi:hypothetical protein